MAKKINEPIKPRNILNPPILGIGFLFCFLSSSKSNNFFFKANLYIKGNEMNEIRNDIKMIHTK